MEAVKLSILNGDADAIASHHIPQNYDAKVCEFEYAKYGMIGLETLFGVLGKQLPTNLSNSNIPWTIEKLITLLSEAPRRIFNLSLPEIKEGAVATLTLFNPDTEFIFDETMIASKSKNTPFIGTLLKGKVIGIVNGTNLHLN